MSTWSSSMEQRFKEQPTLLTPSAGNQSCCICRAPRSLVQFNEKAFQPQIVSIGPYHHGKERLNMVEQHKPRFFSALIERTKDGGVGLHHYFTAVASKENEIRDCYSEFLPCESKALIEMMILDACFIVEVFRIFGRVIWSNWDDPIFTTQWIFPFLIKDLLQIENQIPFSVLQVVFDLSKGDIADKATTPSLNELALGFFNSAFQRPQEQLEKFFRVFNVKHLLDLFRLSFIGHTEVEQPANVYVDYQQLIPSATQLLLSGVNCMPRNDCNLNLLDVQFNHGILQIPPLTLDDCMSSFLLNCVAFEQSFNYSSRHLSSYIIFMRCLVSTEKGAELLSENRILLNYLGSNAEVATFFNDLSMGITIDISTSYLAAIFGQVNRYHEMFLPRTRRILYDLRVLFSPEVTDPRATQFWEDMNCGAGGSTLKVLEDLSTATSFLVNNANALVFHFGFVYHLSVSNFMSLKEIVITAQIYWLGMGFGPMDTVKSYVDQVQISH